MILCVDLDRTLIKTDILHELMLLYMNRRTLFFLKILFFSLFKGRAWLKSQLTSLKISGSLPFNHKVLNYIKEQKNQGHQIYLVTATHMVHAERIAVQLGDLFDGVFATTADLNLKGKNKAQFLVDKFGEGNFEYIGDSFADMAVWKVCGKAVFAGTKRSVKFRLKSIRPDFLDLSEPKNRLKVLAKGLRVHQWAKNALIFVAPALAHVIHQSIHLLEVIQAFFAFSFAASGVYLINDMFDLASDRAHRTKKNRPIASGDLPIPYAINIALLLKLFALIIAFLVGVKFLVVLLGYLTVTTIYTFKLKRMILLDVMTLSVLFTIRLYAGAAATGVFISNWLLTFSLFLFLSLALVKRFSEIFFMQEGSKVLGRGYSKSDGGFINTLGISSGMIAVLILALFVNSPDIAAKYSNPDLIWLLVPLLFYWVARIWLLAQHGRVNEDPIVFAIKDRVSYVIGAMGAVILFVAL